MNTENTADDASNSDDFANLKDAIPPKVTDLNIPAEYLISDNFLIPGVITQYSEEQVLFKPNLSDEILNVPYNKLRHPLDVVSCCKYEVGNKVEVYWLDPKLKLHGWVRCTITSNVEHTYVAKVEQRKAFYIIKIDKIRKFTTGKETQNESLRAVAWRNRAVSFADMQTLEYENFIQVYYGKNSSNISRDCAEDSASQKGDYEDTIFTLLLLLILFMYFDLF